MWAGEVEVRTSEDLWSLRKPFASHHLVRQCGELLEVMYNIWNRSECVEACGTVCLSHFSALPPLLPIYKYCQIFIDFPSLSIFDHADISKSLINSDLIFKPSLKREMKQIGALK